MKRIQSIDVFRLLAMVAVITVHTSAFGDGPEGNAAYRFLHVALDQGARFAVPFFFIMSGYFFSKRVEKGGSVSTVTAHALRRLGLVWLFFNVVYLLPYDLVSAFKYGWLGPAKVAYWNVLNIFRNPFDFVFIGTKIHLWFLVSLAISTSITAAFLGCFGMRSLGWLMVFAITLYVVGLLAKPYSMTPAGIQTGFDTRNGPFFGTVFFVLGYVLSRHEFTTRHFWYGLAVMVFGYVIHFGEISLLYSVYGISPVSHDYVFGTLFMGGGAALMALSRHPLLNVESLAELGKYTLGIYGIHFVFVDVLRRFDRQWSNPAWEIGYILIVLFLSFGASWALSKNEQLRKVFV